MHSEKAVTAMPGINIHTGVYEYTHPNDTTTNHPLNTQTQSPRV